MSKWYHFDLYCLKLRRKIISYNSKINSIVVKGARRRMSNKEGCDVESEIIMLMSEVLSEK